MKIGTTSDFAAKTFGDLAAPSIIKKAGFDSVDFSMFIYPQKGEPYTLSDADFDDYFSKVAAEYKKNSLQIGQTHAPFSTYTGEAEYDEWLIEILKKSIKATAILGSKYIVVHPAMPRERKYNAFIDETRTLNLERYKRLIPELEKYDIYCAIENMFSWDSRIRKICPTTCTTAEEMADYIDTLNKISPHFAACLDVGHANLIHYEGFENVNPAHMVRVLGDRLKIMHMHDNDGRSDLHTCPGICSIDYKPFIEALKEIGYNGVISLEADCFPYAFGESLAQESLALMCSQTRRIFG